MFIITQRTKKKNKNSKALTKSPPNAGIPLSIVPGLAYGSLAHGHLYMDEVSR